MILGKNLYLSLGDGKPVAGARECSLTEKCEYIETASVSSGQAREGVAGRTQWEVSTSGLVSAVTGAPTVGVTYNISFTDGSTSRTGKAICVQKKVSGAVGSVAKYSVTLRGTGALAGA